MEFDSQLLQDLVEFLQTLEGVTLPAKFETLRGRLLGRVRSALSGGTDNYMNMQLGKPLKDQSATDNSSEEYVIPDQRPLKGTQSFLYQQQNKKQDALLKPAVSAPARPPTYLRLVPDPSASSLPAPIAPNTEEPEVSEKIQIENSVPEGYDSLTLAQAQSMSYFSGQLFKREKWFLFENLRPYTAVLIGSHLLSYDNKTDPSPSQILSIEGSKCKHMVKAQRNAKKLADSTFELCCKDNRSYQLIAPTPKEMMQWIAKIADGKTKGQEIKQVNLPSREPPEAISEAEASSDEASSNEDYDNVVITDIAGVLAGSVAPPKPNSSARPPKPPATQKPADPYKTPNHVSPRQLIMTKRTLPPPPPTADDSQIEEEVYHIIDDHVKPCESTEENDDRLLLYDDIETVKRDAQELSDNMSSNKEMGRNTSTPIRANENDVETYDDVDVVKKEAEQMARNESAASPSTQIENAKKSPRKESPAVLGKSSPVKNFWGRLRYKNESPPKEEVKKKPIISIPQQIDVKDTPTKVTPEQEPSKTIVSQHNSQIVEDISDYNSPPSPRPISASNNLGYDEGEPIYDDVDNRIRDVVDSQIVSPEKDLERGQKPDENIVTKFKLRPVPSKKPEKNVARNLSKSFDPEIYENQSGSENVEDDSEFYQVPRAEAKSLENLNDQEIYDDVDIVAQKKREYEQAKERQKPVANKTPLKFNRGPAVMAKPTMNNSFNKLTKLISPVIEKSTAENSIHHRFSPSKKPKPKAAIIPLKKHEINSADEELYDDCHSKG